MNGASKTTTTASWTRQFGWTWSFLRPLNSRTHCQSLLSLNKWRRQKRRRRRVSSTASSSSSKPAQKPLPAPHCCLCKKGHWLDSCPRFLDLEIDEKIYYLNHTNRCGRCIRPHKTSDCRVNVRCDICHGRHHISLHDAFHPWLSMVSDKIYPRWLNLDHLAMSGIKYGHMLISDKRITNWD